MYEEMGKKGDVRGLEPQAVGTFVLGGLAKVEKKTRPHVGTDLVGERQLFDDVLVERTRKLGKRVRGV